ncbi:hypothetical protein GBAR_LOCUS19503 [Geodia barretti]|uniref:PH domain-containing protein n=1 Tax=Geodia barretti TaxID=519541 RepID=A0AA35SST4_GEOBA|nr:hypothetical protein GBAR_LOCUS19503 [Geodia barretti]
MSGQADIIKKASLKVKVVRSKTGAAGLQGPKVFKEFWFVFRALVGGDKILEYHQNERKFQESAAYPKGVLHLGSALAVSYHNPEKKQQFSIELAGGSFIFLEAGTQSIAREWMTCLNAVLFGKGNGPNGALQYFVDVPVGSRLQYAGPSLLEVKDEELTLKTNDGTANLVRWKLAHLRSFKARKDTLTVFSGSRSSTGVGEYLFRTSQSVQITHAIETVVRRLKYEALGCNQQVVYLSLTSFFMHLSLSPPHFFLHITKRKVMHGSTEGASSLVQGSGLVTLPN